MGQRILLVEGKDNVHVLSALFQAHSLPQDFVIKEAGGVEKLLAELRTQLKASELERLALVLDADNDPQARWLQVRERLRALGCAAVPDSLEPQGLVTEGPRGLRIGVWMMPGPGDAGMLEDFLARLVPAGRPAGQALTARYLDPAGPAAVAFLSWVRCALL